MAAETDPAVAQAVERFHQQSVKLTIARLTAEIVDLRVKLLSALACMSSYTEDPNNVASIRATLKVLLSELSTATENPSSPDLKVLNRG